MGLELANQALTQEAAKFPAAMRFLFEKTMSDGITPARYKVGFGGRAAGRTWNYARALLMLGGQASRRVLCCREYQKSIRESVHKTLCDQIDNLRMNYLYEVEQASIHAREGAVCPDGSPNKSDFIFTGLHNNVSEVKSTEGIDVAWGEEAHNLSKFSFETLDPTVRKAGSEIWFSFNTQLETDFVYDFFVAKPPPNAIVRHLTWRDNPWLDDVNRAQMEYMRANDFDAYLNVWEGQPRLMLEGAVYAEELRRVRASGRICTVPYDPNFPVDVIFDLGKRDATAMWFRQQIAFETRIIRAYQNTGLEVEDYLDYLQGLKYFYGTIWLPHDAKAKRLGTKKTIQEQFQQNFGTKNVRIVPKLSIADGISAARQGFKSVYFDKENCVDGLQALSRYRYEVLSQEKDGIMHLSKEPVHDEYSHYADAWRYEAICRKLGAAQPTQGKLAAELQERIDQAVASGIHVHGRPTRAGARDWMKG